MSEFSGRAEVRLPGRSGRWRVLFLSVRDGKLVAFQGDDAKALSTAATLELEVPLASVSALAAVVPQNQKVAAGGKSAGKGAQEPARQHIACVQEKSLGTLFASFKEKEDAEAFVGAVCAQGGSRADNAVAGDHAFKRKHFAKPQWCGLCNAFIWGLGKQGMNCTLCGLAVHARCADSAGSTCAEAAKLSMNPAKSGTGGASASTTTSKPADPRVVVVSAPGDNSSSHESLDDDDDDSLDEEQKRLRAILIKSTEKMEFLTRSQGKSLSNGSDDDLDDFVIVNPPATPSKKPEEPKKAPFWKCTVCTLENTDMNSARCEACDSLRQIADANFGKTPASDSAGGAVDKKASVAAAAEPKKAVDKKDGNKRATAAAADDDSKAEIDGPRTTVSQRYPIHVKPDGSRAEHMGAILGWIKQLKGIRMANKPSLVLAEAEKDDCDNLLFVLKGRNSRGKQVTQRGTLMVPEGYPKGEFMLFTEDGDVSDLGRGTICGMMKQIMENLAKKHAIERLVPIFDVGSSASAEEEDSEEDYDPDSAELDGSYGSDLEGTLTQTLEASLGQSAFMRDMMDDMDDNLSGQMKDQAKLRLMNHVTAVTKIHGPKSAGVYAEPTGEFILRAALPIRGFVDKTIAPIWGLDWTKPIVVEFSLKGPYYLESVDPPLVEMCQSIDSDLSARRLTDRSSFGLNWQTTNRLKHWLKAEQVWPPRNDTTFLPRVMSQIQDSISTCNRRCIICQNDLGFLGLKPAVCENMLCTFSHEQYGLGADVATEVRRNPDVIDMMISFACAATSDVARFTPFPKGIEVKDHDKDTRVTKIHNFMTGDQPNAAKVTEIASKLPDVKTLVANASETATLKAFLDQKDPLCFPLLRWVVTSNRAHLVKIPKAKQIPGMNTEHQYVFMSSAPEKEKQFQELKAKHGSLVCFHGSAFSNWHCILRVGLKNYSNTSFMSCGAAYGAGIYLAADSSTSLGYARATQGWVNSQFGTNSVVCLAICELINDKYVANPYYVIQKEEHVITRILCLYPGSGSASVQASSIKLPEISTLLE